MVFKNVFKEKSVLMYIKYCLYSKNITYQVHSSKKNYNVSHSSVVLHHIDRLVTAVILLLYLCVLKP